MANLLQLGEFISALDNLQDRDFGTVARALDNISNSTITIYDALNQVADRLAALENPDTIATYQIAIPSEE